jgi:hypothetical protein
VPSSKGARKAAAVRLGLDPVEYLNRLADGYAWCSDHHDWHPREMMARDTTRKHGRGGHCIKAGRRRRIFR